MTTEELDRMIEMDVQEADKIRKNNTKKIVNDEKYSEHFDPSDCAYCMNYCSETDTCKKNMPNINPWYTKDNDLPDHCDEWEYVYTTKDGD